MKRLLILTIPILLSGCQSKKNMVSIKEGEEWSYFMRRSSCYGTCPVYEVEIMQDGSMTYVGEQFIDPLGDATGQLNSEDLDSLTNAINEMVFLGLEESYDCGISDFPGIEFVLTHGDEKKRIFYRCEGPESLPKLAKLTDRITRRSLK